VDGTNIFFINLLGVVVFAIVDYFLFSGALKFENPITAPGTIFALALISVIPLAYFIGQAVASISAQSSMGMGATINAFFSTIVEVYLYCIALSEGKGRLVEGSIVGSIFAGVVFMPGLSMCSGALKRKTQRFNAKSAGVTSTMLLFSVIAAFAPTLFYQIYGTVSQLIIPPNLILTFAYSMSSAVVPVPRRATHMMHNAGGVRFRKRRLQIATISTIRPFDPIPGFLPHSCSFLM
jgi:calcium/proton exchanger cax